MFNYPSITTAKTFSSFYDNITSYEIGLKNIGKAIKAANLYLKNFEWYEKFAIFWDLFLYL